MDFAALRAQIDVHLRAMRAGTVPAASPEVMAQAEQAVDVGSQALIQAAAEALGLTDALEVVAAPAAEPAAPEAPATES